MIMVTTKQESDPDDQYINQQEKGSEIHTGFEHDLILTLLLMISSMKMVMENLKQDNLS
jgi:hypothetical protein